jgi:hypothetical protein
MASVINGTNIVLYYMSPTSTYYFNGGINSTTISSVVYKQLGTTNNVAPWVILNRTGDGLVAGFITPIGNPGLAGLSASTWVFNNWIALYENLSGAPKFYIKVSKYNGTTLTEIARSSNVLIIATGNALYTTSVTIPNTVLNANDRIVVEIFSVDIGTRLIEWYTQGSSVNTVLANVPVGIPFGASTNCSFEVSVDQKEVTSQSSAWFKEFKNDVATWSINADGFVALEDYSYLFLANLQLTRLPILVKFQINNDNGGASVLGYSVFTGTANLSSLSLSAGVEAASTYSVSLQGSGAYTIVGTQVNPSGVVVLGSNVVMFDYTAAGSETSITWTAAIGLSCVTVTRGGIEVRTIAVSGAPTGENVTFNSSTGTLTFARALESDEFVRAIFK